MHGGMKARTGAAVATLLIFLVTHVATAGQVEIDYSYDSLGRLTHVEFATGETISYSYDSLGNILSVETFAGVVLTLQRGGTGAGSVQSNPAGIDCGSDCRHSFSPGTIVTLTASPAPGSTFQGWSGDADCSDGQVTMTADRACLATFQELPGTFLLAVNKMGTGTGRILSNPAGLDCGSTCSASFPAGTQVALSATPLSGSDFTGWSGDSDCSDGLVTLSAARNCTATFSLAQTPTFSLTVQTTGFGSGRVWSSPAGIDCPADCSESYMAGAVVNLTAEAHPGSVFAGWSGAGCSGTGACTVTLNAAREVTAVFETEEPPVCTQGWIAYGPEYGGVREIAVDPTQPSHLYATTAGGVFESFDGIGSWRPTGLGGLETRDLLLDPSDPSRIYAAGIGDLYGSEDGGATWQVLRNGLGAGIVTALEIAPSEPATLLAGIYPLGIYRSRDHGSSWSLVYSTPSINVAALRIDPSSASTIFAGVGTDLLVSRDGGTTWSTVLPGVGWVYDILIDRSSTARVFVAAYDRLFQSNDGGRTWTTNRYGFFGDLAQAPSDPSKVFASDSYGGIWSSSDGGRTWGQLTVVDRASSNSLTVDPAVSSVLYLATTGRGSLKSVDGGRTWQETNNGLAALRVSALAQAPGAPTTLWAGNKEGGGIFRTTDTGEHWTAQGFGPLSLWVSDVVAVSESTVYAASQPGVFRSSDGGLAWADVTGSLAGKGISQLAAVPEAPDTVYAGSWSLGIFRTQDGGATWSAIGAQLPAQDISYLEVAPDDPSTVYVQVFLAGTFEWQLYRSSDAGSTWSRIGTGLPTYQMLDLAFDPSDSSRLLAAIGYWGMYRSEDRGVTWRPISSTSAWTVAVAFHPTEPGVLYAGTSDPAANHRPGILRSVDDGATWNEWGEGLVASYIADLAVVPTLPTVVLAATDGRSVYQRIDCPTASLTVTKTGTGTGRVTSVPAGIDCGTDCAESVLESTALTFVSQPDAGSVFSGWSGAGCAGTGTCHVVASGSVTVTATFMRQTFPLTVAITGSGRVTSQPDGIDCGTDCTESFAADTSVNLTALPAAGSVFSGWSGAADCADGQITVNGPVSCTATFAPEAPSGGSFYTLTPCRILDTRTTAEPLLASIPRLIRIAGLCGVPESAVAIAANVTVTQPTAEGWVTLWPAGLGYPGTLTNAFKAGDVRANNAILPLGTGWLVGQPFLSAGGEAHLIIDIFGYFN